MISPPRILPIAAVGELPEDQYVGLIDEDAVACLMVRLDTEGLLSPIWVRRNGNAARPRWSVIAGRHRLLAASRLNWPEIEVVEKAGPTSGPDELRRLQLVENLDRRVLPPIEFACHVMERWRVAASASVPSVARNQQSAAIRTRWSVSNMMSDTSVSERERIDEVTGAACGSKSGKWVQRYRRLHEKIVLGLPDLFARLNVHPLMRSWSAANKLASLNDIAKRKAAETILSRDDWRSIDDALVAAGVTTSKGVPAEDHSARAYQHWGRMDASQQRGFAVQIANAMSAEIASDMIAVFRAKGISDV